jgi:hypothetical protein
VVFRDVALVGIADLAGALQMTPAQQAYLLELVRQYGAACRLSGNGADVTEAYSAIVAALKGDGK